MAFSQIFYHIVFRTKYSEKTIPIVHASKLYKYIWGVIENKNCHLYRINGMEAHIHIFSDLHPSISLSDYIKRFKDSEYFPAFKGWASKYCALTYSMKEKDTIINYIKINNSIIKKKVLERK